MAFCYGSFDLCCQSQSLVCIAGSKSDPFPVRVGLCQGCPLSQVPFIIFIDRISRHSQMVEGVGFSDLRIPSLLFADDVVLLASLNSDLQLPLGWFVAECEAMGMRIRACIYSMEPGVNHSECLPLTLGSNGRRCV